MQPDFQFFPRQKPQDYGIFIIDFIFLLNFSAYKKIRKHKRAAVDFMMAFVL